MTVLIVTKSLIDFGRQNLTTEIEIFQRIVHLHMVEFYHEAEMLIVLDEICSSGKPEILGCNPVTL